MEILFYRYNSICESDIITAFNKLGISVIELYRNNEQNENSSRLIDELEKIKKSHCFMFAFTVNFFPVLSEWCNISGVPYVCWTVDSPVIELFSPSLKNKCNRIFMFDRAQYDFFREWNKEGIFHLPLATNTDRLDCVIANTLQSRHDEFYSDISFVGSLYSEKNAYKKIAGLCEYSKGYVQGLIEAQLQIYGVNFIESMLSDELMDEMGRLVPDMHQPLCEKNEKAQRYLIAHCFIGSEMAEIERVRSIGSLAEYYNVSLYSFSDVENLPKVDSHSGVNTFTEMPLVFHNSKINLNITIRPIITGLSLRVFDVCGCGGFLLTNWQEELQDMYILGREVECYSSQEELIDKAGYYLNHDSERRSIAHRGYERTKAEHTYDKRLAEMIRLLNSTI